MPSEDPQPSFSPSLVFIETTRACDYSCRHCRASSTKTRPSDELSLLEIMDLIDQLENLWPYRPEIIFTGGNALLRPDLKDVISYAARKKFPFSLSPSASERLNDEVLSFLKSRGVKSISLSLDGVSDGTHDWIRNREGSFQQTLALFQRVKKHGIALQINTTVMKMNILELPSIASIVKDSGAKAWEIFFLITTGRAEFLSEVSPEDYMGINLWLSGLWEYGLNVRTVESPVFRVIDTINEKIPGGIGGEAYRILQESTISLLDEEAVTRYLPGKERQKKRFGGTLFFSSNGEVYPSGLFNLKLGQIRDEPVEKIVGRSIDFLIPARSGRLKGKCGSCEFSTICGGSRARSLAHFGDPLEEDPLCTYHWKYSHRGVLNAIH